MLAEVLKSFLISNQPWFAFFFFSCRPLEFPKKRNQETKDKQA